jgi:hypothetical protein
VLVELATVVASLGLCGGCEPAQITYTYSVATKGVVAGDVAEFSRFAQTVYDDPRGWSMNGKIRFRQVPTGGDYTLWLSNPVDMAGFSGGCSAAYSCRSGRNVVINDDRWSKGPVTPGWADDTDYRTMVINHETGHWLGLGHTFCPAGGGVAATVMQQQSISLQGCKANSWPLPQERATVAQARHL